MITSATQDFLQGDPQRQVRVMSIAGLVTAIAVVAVVALATLWVVPSAKAPSGVEFRVVVPSVAPGVDTGTKVILRGAEVGEVTSIRSVDHKAVELTLVVATPDHGDLRDGLTLDFRPQNYFGVTAVNLRDTGRGTPIRENDRLVRGSAEDFTMSTMIEKASMVVDGTLTKSMIDSLDKALKYTDGLTPLVKSGVVIATQVAKTQKHLPDVLLSRMNDILNETPEFSRETIDALYAIYQNKTYNRRPDGSVGANDAAIDLASDMLAAASDKLFALAGNLLKSHSVELTPLTLVVAQAAAPVPGMVDDGATPHKISALVSRYQSAFRGTGRDQTLRLRLLLESVAAGAGSPQGGGR